MSRISMRTSTVTAGIWRLFAMAVVTLCIQLGVVYWNLHDINALAKDVETTERIDRELRELEEDMLSVETGERGYLLTQSDEDQARYLSSAKTAPEHLGNLRALITHPQALDNLERMIPLIEAKLAESAQAIELAKTGRHDAAIALVREGRDRRLMDEFHVLVLATLALEQDLLAKRRALFTNRFKTTFLITILGGVMAIALLFVTAIQTSAHLRRPIERLLEGIQAMSQSDLTHRVSVAENDEIGRVAGAFNAMAAHLLMVSQQQEATNAELQRSNAELDNFAYVASHDLKAPLRGIRNLAGWIEEDLGPDVSDDVRENLRLLNSRVDRLDRLLESMLDYSRVGRRDGAVEEVDVGHLLAEIAEYLAPQPGFEITAQGDLPVLMTPKSPLEKVLRNLIGNALKHHDRDHGQVGVSSRDLGDWVEFRVEDDGPGIAPEFHERIFLMFHTLKPRDQVEGSGMGLAIVKKTVEGLGGTIRVESDLSTPGTAIVFTWPKLP